ncbi:MAG TPA: hypothetical protein VGO47_15315 [Chlamydiales bacterium]|nr:hypothetical protein [Chlamydiales bacterium]
MAKRKLQRSLFPCVTIILNLLRSHRQELTDSQGVTTCTNKSDCEQELCVGSIADEFWIHIDDVQRRPVIS